MLSEQQSSQGMLMLHIEQNFFIFFVKQPLTPSHLLVFERL